MPVATKETKPRKLRENTAFSEEPYASSREHLFDELRWLNRLLAIYVLRLRHVHFYEKLRDFRGLFIADDEIDALMAAGIFEKNGKVSEDDRSKNIKKLRTQALSQRKQIDNRVEQSLANNKNLPLKQLQKIFNLTDFEVHTLLICIAPLLDARYKKLYAYLQNDITRKIASLDLILDLLCEGPEERLHNLQSFHKTSPLRHYSLLHGAENNSDAPIFHDIYQVDPRIIHYILGQRVVDERLESHLRFLPPLAWENVVIANETKARFQMLVDSILSRQETMILYLSGREGVGKKTIARAVCADLALPVAVTDLRGLFQGGDGFQENLRLILREGLLQPCALCFDHFEKLEHTAAENPALFTSFIHELENLGWIIFICSENPMPAQLLDLKTVYAFEMPAPAYKMQVGLWKRCLASAASESESVYVERLATRFNLTGEQITRVCEQASRTAFARDPEKSRLQLSDLFECSRTISQPRLTTLSRKIKPAYNWDDLVLPLDQLAHLKEIARQVKNKRVVMEEMGFGKKLSLGRGISALFSGQSGTGKTMAAEIIANDLGLDMYKIDLSAVVSKYIGETEKNLNRVFTEAEYSNAILFFDEADALLGKRSEVKDAHDRFANIEIAYLLQKMEEYEGVVIMATNLKKNIDDAFVRRIQFIVDFPFPNEVYREAIWRAVYPKETNLHKEIDFGFLAGKFVFAGGNIKNVALRAAYLAAEDGQVVTMKHLVQATRRELQKIGKSFTIGDFGQYTNVLK